MATLVIKTCDHCKEEMQDFEASIDLTVMVQVPAIKGTPPRYASHSFNVHLNKGCCTRIGEMVDEWVKASRG